MTATTSTSARRQRSRLALALDVDDLVAALRLARELQPWFGVAKVGLELYSAAGPDAIVALRDWASTSSRPQAARHPHHRRQGRPGHRRARRAHLTLHAAGGRAMLRAGVEGLREGAAGAGFPSRSRSRSPSSPATPTRRRTSSANRVRTAVEGGCGGIVCAAADVQRSRQMRPRLAAGRPRASAPRRAPTARPGPRRHTAPRRSTPAPTCSSSAGRSPGRRPGGGGRALVDGWPDGRRSRDRHRPRCRVALGCRPCRCLRLHPSSDRQRSRRRRGPPAPRRAQGEAQDGVGHPEELLDQAETDEIVGKMKVLAVLESLPGVGKVKARRMMEEIGISETRRVRGLGEQQRKTLLEAFSG